MFSVYPNPASDNISINLDLKETSNFLLMLPTSLENKLPLFQMKNKLESLQNNSTRQHCQVEIILFAYK
jgi:hypothetical protein